MSVTIEQRKRKRSTSVLVSYLDSTGRRRRPVIGKATNAQELASILEHAERERTRIQHELNEGRHRPQVGEESIDVALLEFVAHLSGSTVRVSTVTAYKETLKKWTAHCAGRGLRRLKDVTPQEVCEFVRVERERGMSANTINGDLVRLQRIWRHFLNRDLVLVSAFKDPRVAEVRPRPVMHERAFTEEERESLLACAASASHSQDASAFVDFFVLLFETGLRLGEGLHLRAVDINLANASGSYLRVQGWGSWVPKTRKSWRTVPLSERVEEMLRRRLHGLDQVSVAARMFPDTWTNRGVNQYFNRILQRSNLHGRNERGEKLRVHSMRHYYATVLVRSGADPATVRDLLGHDSVVTTNRYFNVPRNELFGVVEKAFSRTQRVHERVGFERFPAESRTRSGND